ncbi:hypothetical protein EE612_051925, partial [Oryza sativa]
MAAAAMVFLVFAPCLAQAEERPTAAHPHGLPFESPLALSPDAYEFFHPSERARRGHAAGAAPALSPRAAPRAESPRRAWRGADQEEGGVAPPGRSAAAAGQARWPAWSPAPLPWRRLRRSRWRTPWRGAAWAWRRTATPRRARARRRRRAP